MSTAAELVKKFLIERYAMDAQLGVDSQPVKDLAKVLGNVHCVEMDCPQQDNGCDCGVFMLHYIELFCAPSFLQAFEANPHGALLQNEWFKLEDIAAKRKHLVKVIMDLDTQTPPKEGKRALTILGKRMEVPENYDGCLEYDQHKADKYAHRSVTRQDLINAGLSP